MNQNNRMAVPLLGTGPLKISVNQVRDLPGIHHYDMRAQPITFQLTKGDSLVVTVLGGLSRLEMTAGQIIAANPNLGVDHAIQLAKRLLDGCNTESIEITPREAPA